VSVVWIGVGVVVGVLGRGHDRGPADSGPPAVVPAVVGAAVLATAVAYRRLAGPVAELLDGAARIGGGDYATRVRPSGPRAVRTLGRSFNDMAARLDESEESRRRFLADVTHELRSRRSRCCGPRRKPSSTGSTRARTDAHLEIPPRPDPARSTASSRTAARWRSVTPGRLTLHPEAVSLAVRHRSAWPRCGPSAARRGIALTTAVGADVELDVDPVRLGQVLGNLLSNALRHAPHGGHVTVTTEADDRRRASS
jgi:two-component system OmpR family sensor kinase/two-component system sensor histidine kinase BaeS